MAPIDLTVPTDTREFFRKLGITDPDALDALAFALDDPRDIGGLQRVQHLVMHGCFVGADDLAGYLAEELGTDPTDLGVVALRDLRTFQTVPTAETVRKYLGDIPDHRIAAFVVYLGEDTVEWFWPLIVMQAKASREHHFGANSAFRRGIDSVFEALGRQTLDTMFDPQMTAICLALGMCRLELSGLELTPAEQRWFVPAREYAGYDGGESEEGEF